MTGKPSALAAAPAPTTHAPGVRVCHLGKYYPPIPGGMETHVAQLAREQAAQGARVQVVCVNHGRRTVEERDGPVRVTRVGRLGQLSKIDLCPGLLAALAAVRADVLHVHVPNPIMLLALLALRPAAPVVATYHSDHVRQRLLGPLFRPIELVAFRRVARILATSPPYAESSDLLRRFAARVEVVPLGIDARPFLEPGDEALRAATALRARHGAPLWLSCGRLAYYKGLDVAIRALARVPGTLAIVGDGPERERLEALARGLGVRDRVVFAGTVPDVTPWFLAATALWFPSNARSEAYGLVQLEAMAAGCPVINTAIPGSGVPWVSPHGEAGLTIPVGDAEALAAAARELLDPDRHARLAASGRARARTFDVPTMAARTLAAYALALGRRA